MRILLIQSPTPKRSKGYDAIYLHEPLALEYLGADLAPISDVRILDMRLEGNLPKELETFQPDIIGVTGYVIHVPTIKAICQQAKQLLPKVLTIVGGPQATVSPEDFLHPSIDIITIGDGVPTLREIAQKVKIGKDYREIGGIAFSQNGSLKKTQPRSPTDLDDFPFPDRSLTKRYRKHYHDYRLQSDVNFRTSRGCPYRCNFCTQWKLAGGKYLTRSVENVVKELQQIEEPSINLVDDEAFIDANRMSRLADAIEAAGIKKKYQALTRSDTILRNPQLFEKWKEVGLDRLYIGFEFYAQKDLDFISKNISPEDNEQAIEYLRSSGINVYPMFMVRPDFDKTDFEAFARYVRRLNFKTIVQFSVLTPLPGTDLYEELKEQILDVDYDFFDCMHAVIPTRLPLKEFYGQLARLYWDSNPLKNCLSSLATMPLTRVLTVAWIRQRLLSRLKSSYKEYPSNFRMR